MWAVPSAAFADDILLARSLFNLSLEELMTIQVSTVSRYPEKLSTTPSSIQVITRQEIRRSGATSIPEALRLASNLTVAQQNAHEWIISARGFSSDVGNKLLVLFDGRTVYTPLFSGVFWDRQDYLMEDIERIEVISGPGGTLWGSNAVNGVINIITRSAEDTQEGYVEVGAGSALNSLQGGRVGGKLGEATFFRIYGKYRDHDPESLTDGSDGKDAWDMAQAGFHVDSVPNTHHDLTIQGDHYQNETQLLSGGRSETQGSNVLGRWRYHPSTATNSQLQLYLDHTELTLPVAATVINNTALAPAGTFKDTLDTFDLDFQNRYTGWQYHALIWGAGYRFTHDRNDNAPGLGFTPDDLKQDLYSAFLQDEIDLIPETLTATLGTKWEQNDYTGSEWEPSARLAMQLDEEHLLWAATSRAVRMPSRIDRDISQPASPNFVVLSGGKDFESETMNVYEVGYRGRPLSQLLLSMALFYNEIDHLRSTSLDPNSIFPLYFENNLEGRTHGVEINAQVQALDTWWLRLGYTYLDNDIHVKHGRYDFNNALNENADPNNQITLQSYLDIGEDWEFDVLYRWVDDLPSNNTGVRTYVDKYHELDVHLGWQLDPQCTLALVGQNLLHKHHQEFGIPSDTQQEVGRNLYAKVEWRFQ